MQTDSATLIAGLAADSMAAFDTIYALYAGRLLAFCRIYAKDEEVARTIVQDTFIQLWSMRHAIRTDNLTALLFTIARSRLVNAWRAAVRKPVYVDYTEIMAERNCDSGRPEIEFAEFEATVMSEIDKLPPAQAKVLRLSRFNGMSNKEIAIELSLSEQTVKNQLSAALKVLRRKLSTLSTVLVFFIPWRYFFVQMLS